jgi:hypothetical protein
MEAKAKTKTRPNAPRLPFALRIVLSAVVSALLLAQAACGGAAATRGHYPNVVQPREISAASGAPHVTHVLDLGAPTPLPDGALANAHSDGKFTIGEYVLVEGDDFGKLPTVLIGGRPARVLARTVGGGIITQVPTGVSAGATPVEVSHPGGRHSVSIDVTRYAVVLDASAGLVHFLDVAAADAKPASTAKLTGPGRVRLSVDGAWAYVLGGSELSTIALTGEGGPSVVRSLRVKTPAPVVGLALAGKTLVIVGPTWLQVFLLDQPETTAPYDPIQLAPEVAGVTPIAADLSPDGQTLALLTANNAVTYYSLAKPEAPEQLTTVALLPGKRLPLVRDLRFDGAGTLWVIAGDSRESLGVGHSSTQLIRLDARGGAPRVVDVAGAGPPLAIAPAPRESLKSATTIGDTAGDLPLFVTTMDQKLVAAADADPAAPTVASLAEPGQVVRTDAAGRGGPLKALPGTVAGALALTPDAQLLLATAWSFAGGASKFGVWISGVGADAAPRFVELSQGPAQLAALPSRLGAIAVQP